jgi:cysteine desulfurase
MIYLDHASATPIEREVARSMQKTAEKYYANGSAVHEMGLQVKNIIEEARKNVAKLISARPKEIIFTSGATESNNLAILGVVPDKKKLHIVATNIEHSSVLEICRYLEKSDRATVTLVEVEQNGVIDPQKIRAALRPDTTLVSVMYANNEIGTVQPIVEIARVIRTYNKNNKTKILFHTDATQAMNYLEVNILKLGVDLLSFNAAKIYGPKGIGVLFAKDGTRLAKIMHGGNQEHNLRPGTENVVSIVGLAKSLELTEKIKNKEINRLTKLQDYLLKKLTNNSPAIIINGDRINRLPNNVNVTIPKIPSDLLVIELAERGIMAAAKSACKSGEADGSYVIAAIHPENGEIGGVRFTLGRGTTKNEIDYTLKNLKEIVKKLEKWYH